MRSSPEIEFEGEAMAVHSGNCDATMAVLVVVPVPEEEATYSMERTSSPV